MGSLPSVGSFELIPAIDVRAGRRARMERGDPHTLREVAGDPAETAAELVAGGARWLHVVDLDAALTGRPANQAILRRIADLPVAVQAGGGLGPEGVAEAIELGAARAVLGASALSDLEVAAAAFRRNPGRVAVGLDLLGDRIVPRGGRVPPFALEPVLRWLAGVEPPPARLVVTHVERDGTMAGPDLTRLASVAERTGIPVIASGGVRSLEDLRAIAALGPGVVGAVVGRALQEHGFSVAEALEAVD